MIPEIFSEINTLSMNLRLVTSVSLVALAVAARVRASFDFDWRYILGDQGFIPPAPVRGNRQLANERTDPTHK